MTALLWIILRALPPAVRVLPLPDTKALCRSRCTSAGKAPSVPQDAGSVPVRPACIECRAQFYTALAPLVRMLHGERACLLWQSCTATCSRLCTSKAFYWGDKESARSSSARVWAVLPLQAALLALPRKAIDRMRHRQHSLLLQEADLCSRQSLAAGTDADTMRLVASTFVQHRQQPHCQADRCS